MTAATRLRAAMRVLHWSQPALARETGVSVRTVAHWLAGTYEPPGVVLGWLERLAEVHQANPPPPRSS